MSTPDPQTSGEHADVRLVDAKGPWPFESWRVFQSPDGTRHVWSSRHHRKRLGYREPAPATEAAPEQPAAGSMWRCLWMPGQLNWWIGIIFALGSLLFAVASLLSLAPELAKAWSLDSTQINAIFFVGSIPFTIAAYLQLFQAANAGEFDPGRAPGEKGSDLSRNGPQGASQKRVLTPFRRPSNGVVTCGEIPTHPARSD